MIFEKKRVRHHHEQDHNSDHFHESNHSHGDSIESKDEKTLKILLVHWVNQIWEKMKRQIILKKLLNTYKKLMKC